MAGEVVSLTYQWTAQQGKGDELKAIYEAVGEHARAHEPDMLEFRCYGVEGSEDVIIHEVFRNGAAVGVHLQKTAAEFFPQLMAIATPGPFFFRGDVPAELQQALRGMNLGAVFATSPSGFSRDPATAQMGGPRPLPQRGSPTTSSPGIGGRIRGMSRRSQLRGFLRAFRANEPRASRRHRGHAIARTLKHGTTIIGGNANASLGNLGNQRREDLMTEASERYDASFDKD